MSGAAPYQGFAFSYREAKMKIQGNSTATAQNIIEWGKSSGTIIFNRINNVLYCDNNLLIDYKNIVGSFNAPLSFAANIDNNGNPRRYCKADLSDMTVKLQYTYSELMNIVLPVPLKTGHTFDGWYTEEIGGTKITTPSVELLGNKTIYAHWIPTSYNVSFKANGGTGSMPNQGFVYGTAGNLSANTFKPKYGYEFKGWNTKANGTGLSYVDEESIVNLGNITLYAQWELATLVTQAEGADAKFLNGPINKNQIESLTFSNSISESKNTQYDVSNNQKGSILCWYTDLDGDNLYEVTIGTTKSKIIANPDSSDLCSYIGYNENSDDSTCIYGIEHLDTSIVTNMQNMFKNCGFKAMTDLDLGDNFDTSKVTNMNGMFWHCGCSGMNSLDLGSKFDTSKVTDMKWMFQHYDQYGIKVLNLGDKFDTSKITNMDRFFNGLQISSIDLGSKFDTSNCETMVSMFENCLNLETLNLGSNFDTSKCTKMRSMFFGCKKLTTLNLGSDFNTSNVTDMSRMFLECKKLQSLNLGDKFDTSNVIDMNSMFTRCGMDSLTSFNLGDKFDTSNVIDMHNMFYGFGKDLLTSLDLGNKFNTLNVTDMSGMFYMCGYNSMTTLDIRAMSFDENVLTQFNNIFNSCGKQGDSTVYVNQDYESFVINNKSSNWSSIIPVPVN